VPSLVLKRRWHQGLSTLDPRAIRALQSPSSGLTNGGMRMNLARKRAAGLSALLPALICFTATRGSAHSPANFSAHVSLPGRQ
jgi:hypothetical protein